MKTKKYDIFISYRRDVGAQYARILQLMLIQRGYKVFLDYDELKDGTFSDRIIEAIRQSEVFMPVLSAGSMKRCANDGDWVRREIMFAVEQGKHFVPVNPDRSFDGVPEEAPEELKMAIEGNQHSEVSFGQLLGASVDHMITSRLVDIVGSRQRETKTDADFDAARETLRRMDAHHRFMKRLAVIGVSAAVLIVLVTCLLYWQRTSRKEKLEKMRTEINERHSDLLLQLSPDLTATQMAAIDTLLTNMSEVYPDSIRISQFEYTVGLWHEISGEPFDESERHLPMTNVSYADIYLHLMTLNDLTNLNFELPSVETWEYAAHGGANKETTVYSGSDDAEQVSWNKTNSGSHAHPSDGQQGKLPNYLDLFDMSGNVAELCNTPFDDSGRYTVCGGDYESPVNDVAIGSRRGIAPDEKNGRVGFRVTIRKP